MTLRVRYTKRAERDVQETVRWLQARSVDGAARWYKAFFVAVAEIADNPHSAGLAPEASRLRMQIRQKLFRTRRGHWYRLLFVVDYDELLLVRLRGPGQRPLKRRDIPRDN